jgi:hypothetical protein
MQLTEINTSEVAILARVLEPDEPTLAPEAARALLALDFSQADKDRMRQLSAKAREGTLSPDEQAAINKYERVGHLLNIMQSKARRSLKEAGAANGPGRAWRMERELEDLVWRRAGNRCEYCRVPQEYDRLPFEIDHVIAKKHRGPTRAGNLCLACFAWK